MKLGGQSDPRNKALMKMFNIIGIGERAGSGVPELFSVWKDQGWVEPIIKEEFDPDRTILIMKFLKRNNKEKVHKKRVRKNTLDQYEMILSFMEEDVWYQAIDFINLLKLKKRRIQVLMKDLLNEGKIIDNGYTKGKKYKKI